MLLKDVIFELRNNSLPNVTTLRQMQDESLFMLINEGITALHNLFVISIEQAIILVPDGRHTFKISNQDPNVIMASHYKIADCEIKSGGFKTKADLLEALVNYDKDLKKQILMQNEVTDNKKIFEYRGDEVLQILDITGDENSSYRVNEQNVMAIDQITLYFPKCKEADIIYVKYKPKPKKVTAEAINEHIAIPDTLLSCLYSFIALRVITGIEKYREFYSNVLNSHNKNLQDAINSGPVFPDSLNTTLEKYKGFI